MWFLSGDQMEAFIDDSVLEGLVVTVAEEDHMTALFLPRLGQSQTAHDVAYANLGACISPDKKNDISHQESRFSSNSLINVLRLLACP